MITALIVTVIVGGIVTKNTLKEYLTDSSPWLFLGKKIIMFFGNPAYIIGVFEHNLYPKVVNGSLWTIPYEFFFYGIISPIFLIRKVKILPSLLIILSVIALTMARYSIRGFDFIHLIINYIVDYFKSFYHEPFFDFVSFFAMGSFLFVCRKIITQYKLPLLIASLSLIIISIIYSVLPYTKFVLLPIAVISFGLMNTKYISGLSKKMGDLSYGTYLYAFLIQQTLLNYFNLNEWQLTLITTPISLLFGFLSWNLVEKRFLRLKSKIPSSN